MILQHLLDLTKDVPVLHRRLIETLDLYLTQSFEDDRVAKLDQAGETDPERTTLLHQVFVDLELKPRSDQPRPPRYLEGGANIALCRVRTRTDARDSIP